MAALVLLLQTTAGARVAAAAAPAQPAGAVENPLKGLAELPKVHHSWPIPAQYFNATAYDGVIVDYARITGSLAPSPDADMAAAVDICGRATKASTSGRQVGIGLNYGCLHSPAYGSVAKNGTGPGTGCNASCEAAGVATFTAQLQEWRAAIDSANAVLGLHVPVVAMMFDCETFTVGSFDVLKNGQVAITGITRHNELMFNATRSVFPSTNTTIVNYDYGQAEWWPRHDRPTASAKWNDGAPAVATAWKYFADSIGKPSLQNPLPAGWAPRPGPLSFREQFHPEMPFSCSLYEVQDPFMTRERFKYTSELALARGVLGGAVMPYIALGQGWHRGNVTQRPWQGRGGTNAFSMHYDYDTALSAQIGAQMNRKEYEHSDFGPWERATGAVFFTSAFCGCNGTATVDGSSCPNGQTPAASTAPGSLHTMKHFIAYVEGATGAAASIKTDDHRPLAPHLTVMTYYTHPKLLELEILHEWVTVVSEQGRAADAVATWSNWSLPSLVGELPWDPDTPTALISADALLMYSNLKNRTAHAFGYLQPQWREALSGWAAPMLPLFANGTAQGIFTGDERGCGTTKVNPANYSAILKELRAIVGPGVIIYANDCFHDISSSLHPKNDTKPGCCIPYPTPARPSCPCDPHDPHPTPGYPTPAGNVDFKTVPAEFDLVSMDCYSKPSYENASMEVAYAQAYYNENIFPGLQKHQRVLLVPGTFACQDMGLAASDTEVALKLELYLAWAESDKRIIGFNPWHLMTWASKNNRGPVGPDTECGGEIGPGSGKMPKTLAVLKRIGEGIRNNSQAIGGRMMALKSDAAALHD